MYARVQQIFLHRHRSRTKYRVGCFFVACFPRKNMVVMLTLAVRTFGLAGQIFPQHRSAGLERVERIDHDRQLFIFNLDRFDCISGDVTIFRNNDGDFLHLKVYFFICQHGSHIAGQGWHPVQLQGFEIVGGQDSQHTGNGQCFFFVDFFNARVRQRRAHNIHVQHTGKLDVVDVMTFALNEARVFFTQA